MPDAYDLFATLAAERSDAEVDAVAAVICDTRSMAFAEAAGAHADLFMHADLRLIFRACDLGRDMDRLKLLRVIRAALKDAGHWNARSSIGFGSKWNDESLAVLADTAFFCRSAITRDIGRLVAIDERQREAEASYRHAVELLEGRAEASGAAPLQSCERRPTFFVLHGNRGAA